MAPLNPPKDDRAGGDYQRGSNPTVGGEINTGDGAVPPSEDRNVGSPAERSGTARAFSGAEPDPDPGHPEPAEAPIARWQKKQDGCIKVVLRP